jgi:hypothetical protein
VAEIDAFVELLRDAHGARRRKAQRAAGRLLQAAGDERRRGVLADFLASTSATRSSRRCKSAIRRWASASSFTSAFAPFSFAKVAVNGARGSTRLAAFTPKIHRVPAGRRGWPFRARTPAAAPPTAPARARRAGDAAPQHRADLVADHAVEDAPRLLAVHAPLVDLAGFAEGLADRAAVISL